MGHSPEPADDSSPRMGRREQNKVANRQAILKAGLKVFSEIGFDASAISDIVSESGLSVGTFYNYYGDKESVFEELVMEILTRTRSALKQARSEATSVETFVIGAFRAYATVIAEKTEYQSLISKNSHVFRQLVFGEGKIAGIFSDLEADMAEAIRIGLLPAFPVRLMTAAMVGASAEVLAPVQEDEVSSEDITIKAEFLGQLFLGGIKQFGQQH